MKCKCPHCDSHTRARSSRQISPEVFEALMECSNAECGWRGKMYLEYVTTHTPSRLANPAVSIPMDAVTRRALLAQLHRGVN